LLKDNQNLSQGPFGRKLLYFTLPLLASSLIQQLYHTVDLIFVGRLIGKEASAAVGASALLVTCLIGFFVGLSIGSSVAAAKYFGAKNLNGLKTTIHTAMVLSFIGGTVLMVLGLVSAPFFLKLLNTPEDILVQAVSYIRIYFLSFVSIVSYNIGSGLLRALGDSSSPMISLLIGGFSNVLANVFFIVVLNWGVEGAAAATFISQSLAAFLVLRELTRLDDKYKLKARELKIDRKKLSETLLVGIPAGFQAVVITLSNLVVQYHINSLGVDNVAAFTAYFRVELIIYLPIMALGQATTVFTGQNIGAGQIIRLKKGLKNIIIFGLGLAVFLSFSTLLFSAQAFSLFSSEAEVIELGRKIAFVTFPFYFLYVFIEVLASSFRGAGRAVVPMVIIILNIGLLRCILLYPLMSHYHSAEGVALVYPLTWTGTALCLWLFYFLSGWLNQYKSTAQPDES
jgi:putative MATE family efflux protein